jgi:16S rRNA (guanine966-N2)-methyltransferase
MRIIAGAFRGRTLVTVRDLSVRPMTDRVKQAVFDVLAHRLRFEGAAVLDLFSGSGSLGLEAISRGAQHATFVDVSGKSLETLERNIESLNCTAQCAVYRADVFWYLKNFKRKFDLVFADPPYALENIGNLPNAIYDSGIVHKGSYAIMEHNRRSAINLNDRKYEIVVKPFGQTTVLILKAIVPPITSRT